MSSWNGQRKRGANDDEHSLFSNACQKTNTSTTTNHHSTASQHSTDESDRDTTVKRIKLDNPKTNCVACQRRRQLSPFTTTTNAGTNHEYTKVVVCQVGDRSVQLYECLNFVRASKGSGLSWTCDDCQVDCSSATSLFQHVCCKRHRKKLRQRLCTICRAVFQKLVDLYHKQQSQKVRQRKPTVKVNVKAAYTDSNATNYHQRQDILATQREMTQKVLALLGIDPSPASQRFKYCILDVGCGSGMSSQILQHNGHLVIGCDISHDMLKTANTSSHGTTRNHWYPPLSLMQCDMGGGIPIRPGLVDFAVGISSVQWLVTQPEHSIRSRWSRSQQFFQSLNHCLKRVGSLAVFQVYLETRLQARLLCEAAWTSGFIGALVFDYPHASKRRKWFLCLDKQCAVTDTRHRNIDSTKQSTTQVSDALCRHYEDSALNIAEAKALVEACGRAWGNEHTHWSSHGLCVNTNTSGQHGHLSNRRCPLAMRFQATCALYWWEHLHNSGPQRQFSLKVQPATDVATLVQVVVPHHVNRLKQYHLDSLHHLLRHVRYHSEQRKGTDNTKQRHVKEKLRPHDSVIYRDVMKTVEIVRGEKTATTNDNGAGDLKKNSVPDRQFLAQHCDTFVRQMHDTITKFCNVS